MRLLVIGNHCLSESESNGRITRTLLSAFKGGELFNFALRGNADCDGVDNCVVGDAAAFKSFVTLGIKSPNIKPRPVTEPSANSASPKSSKAISHCLRDVVWFSSFWRRGAAKRWLDDVDADAVFLMAADAPFLFALARKYAQKHKVPLFIYSSEDYFIKRYNYMERKTEMNLWCRMFLRRLRLEARRAFRSAAMSFLCSDKLLGSVRSAFGSVNAEVMYQPSLLKPREPKVGAPIKRIVYAGNINQGRLASLLDIAEVIHGFDPSLKLELYGHLADEWSKAAVDSPLVEYKGVVPYQELMTVYGSTDLLVHAEGFDEYTLLDYAHAFSTKIGDCYGSGIPFFVYGPREIPCIRFGLDHCPDFSAASKDELKDKLTKILSGEVLYRPDASFIQDCFSADVVSGRLRKIIASAVAK